MSLTRSPAWALALAASVVLAGCGSTAPPPVVGQRGPSPGAVALAAPQPEPGREVAQGAPVPRAGGPAARPVVVATAARPREEPAGTRGARSAPAPGSAPRTRAGDGTAPRTLRLGHAVADDAGAFLAALGVSADFGDLRGSMRALVADVNRRGGVLGARVELVTHVASTAEAARDPSVSAQAACEDLGRDRRVDVVVSTVSAINTPVLFACLRRSGVPVVLLDPNPHSLRDAFERFPGTVFHPATIATERLAPVWVARLAAQGWFGGWDVDAGAPAARPARLGVLYQSGNRTFLQSLAAALTRHGQPPPEAVEYADFQDAAGKMPAYAFQLRARGVTHVLVDKPVSMVLFARAAESQQYRPRYGISTHHGPSVALTANAPHPQLRGAAGVGFMPLADLPGSAGFASYRSPGSPARRCDALHAAAAVPARGQLARLYQRLQCDAVRLVEDGFTTGRSRDAVGLQRGLAARTTAVPGAAAEQVRFGPGRRDGAASVRDLRYDSRLREFVYGGARTVVP